MDNNKPQYLLEEHIPHLGGLGFYIMPHSSDIVYVVDGVDKEEAVRCDVLVQELRALADKIEK